MRLIWVTIVAVTLATSGADISEDFEGGMGNKWVSWRDDNGGHWLWRNSSEVDNMPARPAGDAGVVMVFPNEGSPTAAAHLYSMETNFQAGSKIKMSYWVRSQYAGAVNLILKSVIGGTERNPGFLDLSHDGTPDNDQWRDVEVDVPISGTGRICVFGFRHDHPLDAIAVDDLVLVGIDGETRLPLYPTPV